PLMAHDFAALGNPTDCKEKKDCSICPGLTGELGTWCSRDNPDLQIKALTRHFRPRQPGNDLSKRSFAMRTLAKKFVSFLKKEDGPTAVEYAVMLALIIVVCIAAITTLGSNANDTFSFVGSNIKPPSN